jgi:eukaryotic-like serine/threonine-protein kinase
LAKRFPEDTIVQYVYLPTIRAELLLGRDPAKALELLQPAAPYELGVPSTSNFSNNLYATYVRAEAQAAARNWKEAAVQFQKVIDARGIAINEPIAALAYLGRARADVATGDGTKGKTSYDAFFQLWKQADPDIPVLKAARAEYAKLQ